MCNPADFRQTDSAQARRGPLAKAWLLVRDLVLSVIGYLRLLFVLYGPLPQRTHPASGKTVDSRMADTAEEAVERASQLVFPPGFLFGSATAAYQVEGGLDNCNWHTWEQRKVRDDGGPTVEGGQGAGAACNMWERFEGDVEHMRDLGLKSYRFSIEWSRVEPREGEFDEAAIERYRSWCAITLRTPASRRRLSQFCGVHVTRVPAPSPLKP